MDLYLVRYTVQIHESILIQHSSLMNIVLLNITRNIWPKFVKYLEQYLRDNFHSSLFQTLQKFYGIKDTSIRTFSSKKSSTSCLQNEKYFFKIFSFFIERVWFKNCSNFTKYGCRNRDANSSIFEFHCEPWIFNQNLTQWWTKRTRFHYFCCQNLNPCSTPKPVWMLTSRS